jgi:hypothetical protein
MRGRDAPGFRFYPLPREAIRLFRHFGDLLDVRIAKHAPGRNGED